MALTFLQGLTVTLVVMVLARAPNSRAANVWGRLQGSTQLTKKVRAFPESAN